MSMTVFDFLEELNVCYAVMIYRVKPNKVTEVSKPKHAVMISHVDEKLVNNKHEDFFFTWKDEPEDPKVNRVSERSLDHKDLKAFEEKIRNGELKNVLNNSYGRIYEMKDWSFKKHVTNQHNG